MPDGRPRRALSCRTAASATGPLTELNLPDKAAETDAPRKSLRDSTSRLGERDAFPTLTHSAYDDDLSDTSTSVQSKPVKVSKLQPVVTSRGSAGARVRARHSATRAAALHRTSSSVTSRPRGRTSCGRCEKLGIEISMGSVGDCCDNAMCESFFASLECELIDRRRFEKRTEARREVFPWIEGWYNAERRHSSIDYFSPMRFEQRHLSQEVAA